MTITHGYCTLEEFKSDPVAGIESSDSANDSFYEAVIESASRDIDDICHRWFWSDSDDVSRYYTAQSTGFLFVDDIASPSSDVTVAIDLNGDGTIDTTFTASDFVLSPYNAEANGVPYQKIEAIGQYNFPKNVIRGVKVTTKWGWPSVPQPIQKATLLQSYIIAKYYATPLGVQSMTALGQMNLKVPGIDPRVMFLVSRYIKPTFG